MRLGLPLDTTSQTYKRPTEPPKLCGVVYPRLRHVISGPPESLKTLVTIAICLEHVRAGNRVAYFDFENGPWRFARIIEDLGATEAEHKKFVYVEPEAAPDEDDVRMIIDMGVSLVVVDSSAGAYAVSGFDDNSRMDAERFGNTWIKPFWMEEVTTIVIDHVTKASIGGGSKFTIGSERKVGMADVHLGLESVTPLSRGTKGLVRVKTHKDRAGHLLRPTACEIELDSDPFTNLITWGFRPPPQSGDAWRPLVLMDRVVEHFERFPDPLDEEDVVNAVYGNPEYIKKAIDVLIVDGKLGRDENGRVQLV